MVGVLALLEDVCTLLRGTQLALDDWLGILESFLDFLGLQLDQALHRGEPIDIAGTAQVFPLSVEFLDVEGLP